MTGRWSWHGGGLSAARAHYGDAAGPWIDLSTGINPHGWPGAADIAIDWRRLPEEDGLHALEGAAARHFGVDPAHVCALPGSEIGLRLLGPHLGAATRHRAPSYRTHGEMAPGSRPIATDALTQAGGQTLILANPNNPDGQISDPALLRALLSARDTAAWLVLDEAFADATPLCSMAGEVGEDRRLIVLRSFGKFFGLAGLRLGFLLGPRALLMRIRETLGAWPVSGAAIALGTAAYRDTGWIADTRTRLPMAAAALDAVLARHGLRATGDCPLFRLIETDDAHGLFDRLARHAILTRPFDDQPRWLRIGLPADADALARLDAALP